MGCAGTVSYTHLDVYKRQIYDGSFSGKTVKGEGVTAELLRKSGFRVFSENQINDVQSLIDEEEGAIR